MLSARPSKNSIPPKHLIPPCDVDTPWRQHNGSESIASYVSLGREHFCRRESKFNCDVPEPSLAALKGFELLQRARPV